MKQTTGTRSGQSWELVSQSGHPPWKKRPKRMSQYMLPLGAGSSQTLELGAMSDPNPVLQDVEVLSAVCATYNMTRSPTLFLLSPFHTFPQRTLSKCLLKQPIDCLLSTLGLQQQHSSWTGARSLELQLGFCAHSRNPSTCFGPSSTVF